MIALENVSKSFGSTVAVSEASFTVDRGEVVGFLGPNGAGKSTSMRLITNYLEPDSGAVLLDGSDIREDPVAAKRRMGYLPENNPLYPDMLVSEFLRLVSELRGMTRSGPGSPLDDAVQATGVAEVFYRPIGELSKGYRQRLGLAAAILPRPDFLILDEPTEGLDPNQRQEIRRLIHDIGRERTVILSTHVLPEVEETCQRIIVIHEGKIVADGPTDELVARARGRRTIIVEVEGDGVESALSAVSGVEELEVTESREGRLRVKLSVGSGAAAGTGAGPDPRAEIFRIAVSRGWVLWELHQEAASLEALFTELTN
ncbi:MAG: ATP-binding cassette domain-containing protein [Gemmatimonadota bacterium]